MRLTAVVVLAACGSSSSPPRAGDVPDDHKLHDVGKDTPEVLRLAWFGKQVSLAEMPMVMEQVGLPVTGTADVAIDVEIPKSAGTPDYKLAKGTVSIACTKCQIGDDKARLKPKVRNPRQAAFVGDGIAFGHIAVDSLRLELVIGAGRVELTSWKLTSPDLELEVSLGVELGTTLKASALKGCMRFKATEELKKRDAATSSLLALTGAARGADGFDHIELSGTVDNVRKNARECK